MGGALIDAGGGLIHQGLAEVERERAVGSDRSTWRRVLGYWRATPDAGPLGVAGGSALQQRANIVDRPWSAAFISHVMRTAGLGRAEFRASASHHDYVRAAFASARDEMRGADTRYAYRACDLAATAPRVGDLLCATREGDARFDTFEQVAVALRAGPLQMHCELVVHQDSSGIAAIGGNVVQSVTLRRMGLEADGSGRLWTAYLESEHRREAVVARLTPAAGQAQALLPDTYLNRRPWSVLLQLREGQPALAHEDRTNCCAALP
ncbi:MAG TPA: DUF2272 domain-containing protein [Ottowia sp.]|uniref:DUF2272 domain-containing protein n=1 Tax=Ottowia sp. TaxID=1898956 RepID=UPI002CCCA199|nr:DUF2272 domain-containing protein [Ottowia sp.]HMN20963.1 DUF2272 domain-containing protein [Ottowia sp.]